MSEKLANEANQALYEWAILQIISLDKWNLVKDRLMKIQENNINALYEKEKQRIMALDLKDYEKSKKLNKLHLRTRSEIQELNKSYSNYTNTTKRLVEEFRNCDSNAMMDIVGERINQWFKENFQVYYEQ